MTRIQLASDLHLERLSRFPGARLVEPAPDAELLVLAGDIANGAHAVEAFRDWPVPTVLIAGNHESYGGSLEQVHDDIREACRGSNITYLQNESFDFADLKIFGATLWTDFKLRGHSQTTWMREVGRGLADYQHIRTQAGLLTPADTLAEHEMTRRWLECELAEPARGKTIVVVTHHLPHPLSIDLRYVGSRFNAGFASDLTPLLFKADLWLHGHSHSSARYRVSGCQVVANPAGYVLNVANAETPADFRLENTKFDSTLVIDTKTLEQLQR